MQNGAMMSVSIPDYTKLSVPERIKLIGDIWDSIVAEGSAPRLSPEQKVELDRRRALADSGEAEWVSWDEVKQSLRTGR